MDAEPFEGEDSIVLRSRASARKTKPSVKTPMVVCEIADSIELVEQAYITPKKKKEEADKSQENERGQGNAQPSSEEDNNNTSLETIMVDSSMDTSASMEGITVEEVWQIKEGEEFEVDKPKPENTTRTTQPRRRSLRSASWKTAPSPPQCSPP